MIKSKKQMYIVVGAFLLVLMLGTITYAFFNYTRTGSTNTIKVGRIAFTSDQGTPINLTNMFPIEPTVSNLADPTKVGTVTIDVSGDTTYNQGVEYLVTAVNVQNTVGSGANQKTLPISIAVSYEAKTNKVIGTEDSSYFADRGSTTSYYKVLSSDTINNGDRLLVGYIKPDNTGIDGTITITAYLDASKVAITDTYPERTVYTVKSSLTEGDITACGTALTGVVGVADICDTSAHLQTAIDNGDLTDAQISALVNAGIVSEYTDGTTSTWVNNRVVLTTEEWNSLQANGVSFQVRIEANEGIWVKEQIKYNANGGTVSPAYKEIENNATTYGTLATPTAPQGYQFDGWYTDPVNGTEVTSSTAYTQGTSPTTLYAHYSVVVPTIASCPGCKYMFTTNEYQYGGTDNEDATLVSSLSGVTSNYTTLNKNYFLGFTEVDDGNGNMVIERAFACGIKGTDNNGNINQGTAFCIEGSTYGSTYDDNVALITGATLWDDVDYEEGRCTYDGEDVDCNGSVRAFAGDNGLVHVDSGNSYCEVDSNNFLICYE